MIRPKLFLIIWQNKLKLQSPPHLGGFETSKTSELFEPLIDKPEASKPPESIKLSNKEASFTFPAR